LKRLDGWWNQKWIRVLEKELPCFAADEKGWCIFECFCHS
jgi:hypothetical protein